MYLIYVPLLGLAMGYTFWMKSRAAKAAETSRPAAISYFQRTGYCYADRLGMPPEVQADRAGLEATEMAAIGKKQMAGEDYEFETHLVRDYHGLVIHFRTSFGF